MKNNFKYIFALSFLAFLFACEGPLELDPAQSIDSEKLITDANSAEVAMNGLYSNAQDLYGGITTIIMDVASDITDHIGTFPNWNDIEESNQFPDNTGIDDPWEDGYELIYNANVVLSVLPTVEIGENQTQFLGEARALRAYTYYYLANMFGDIPLIQNPVSVLEDVNVASSSEGDIMNFVVSELNTAVGELGDGSSSARVNKSTVNAMLAKVHMSLGNWGDASSAADAVINTDVYSLAPNYMDLFGAANAEHIFRIPFNSTDANSLSFYYWDTPGGRHEVGPSDAIRNYLAATPGDARNGSIIAAPTSPQSEWQVSKYSDFALGTDAPILLRYADILLIKAEALAEQGDYTNASAYFNMVRERSLPGGGVTLTGSNFKETILNERMVELAWEGGSRWIDMQRTNLGTTWVEGKGQPGCKVKWPIPRAEVDANTAITQNPCY